MSLTYCEKLVRQYDPDRFLLTLMMPQAQRGALFALFAMNYEIAKTREVVSETATGLIRLQWWREAIAKIYDGDILAHEVVKPLAEAIRAYDLPQEWFETLLYAREFDVEDRQPDTMDGFLKYCEYTSVPLARLALRALGQEEEGVEHVAVRYAAIGLVRAVPYHIAQRRCYLPAAVMQAHGVSISKIYDWNNTDGLSGVVGDILEALPMKKMVKAKFLKKMNALSALYQKQLLRYDLNPFDARMQIEPPFRALKVWAA